MSHKRAKCNTFVDQLSPNTVQQLVSLSAHVRDEMIPIFWPNAQNGCPVLTSSSPSSPSINIDRKWAIALIDALRSASDDQLMAFCCVLASRGCCLELLCKMLADHLVDGQKLEHYAKTRAALLANNGISGEELFLLATATKCCESIEDDEEENESCLLKEETPLLQAEFLQHHSELLRLKLVEPNLVAALLYHWSVIGQEQWECIKEKPSPSQKSKQLVTILLAQPNVRTVRSFDCLCVALLLTRQFQLFSIFNEFGNLKRMELLWQKFVEYQQQQLASNGMSLVDDVDEENDDDDDILLQSPEGILHDLQVRDVADAAQNTGTDLIKYYTEHKSHIYPNFSSPRGFALVINNYRFAGRQTREGTQADRDNIVALLRKLNYEVLVRNDLAAEEMWLAIRHFASLPEHENADSCIVVAMSHGEHDGLLGTDDNSLDLHQFVSALNSQNCPALGGKPKIFIIQACRGDIKDFGVSRAISGDAEDDDDRIDGAAMSKSSLKTKRGPLSMYGSRNNSPRNSMMATVMSPCRNGVCSTGNLSVIPTSPSSTAPKIIRWIKEPTYADILIAQSTTAHHVSWRNSSRGSWFVQALCRVFGRWAAEEDICHLLTRVHRHVARIEGASAERAKQIPEMSSTLRKRFFFFPGVKQPIF